MNSNKTIEPGRSIPATPLQELSALGQSIWLDFIRKSLMESGELKRLIAEDGLKGMTSNPSIFEKAIAGSADYSKTLESLARQGRLDAGQIYERLAIADIQEAADALKPVYQESQRRDGYVSLEVSPHLANDAQGTVSEALRLWAEVSRPNLMIKVPGTPEGLKAIPELLYQGINVNITLLFSRNVYEDVAWAYVAALERRAKEGLRVSGIASVASFFVSRIDTAVDEILLKKGKEALIGQTAVANAKLAYRIYQELTETKRWKNLARQGAMPQRLLWASTSTKNPKYPDTLYVDELIGPDTVNTVPPATLEAFRDHGRPRLSLIENLPAAEKLMKDVAAAGVSIEEVTERLLEDGLRLFSQAYDKLLEAIAKKSAAPGDGREPAFSSSPATGARQALSLPPELSAKLEAALEQWQSSGNSRRLWARDAGLWTGSDEAKWMGWLGIIDEEIKRKPVFEAFRKEVLQGGFTHAALLGMGGSSLAPFVFRDTFGKIPGFPELCVLDSTDPAQIRAFESRLDPAKTLFIVSSKSGSTLEPNIFMAYFLDKAKDPRRFIAVTDPGSALESEAVSSGFLRVFHGVPSIGGRYSALSDFGLIPALAMGVDVPRLLENARRMAAACSQNTPARENPGVVLGALLGVLAREGRDKVTLIASPGIRSLGAWLEQLLAESTGKNGKGLIPVDGETLGNPSSYGKDRVFAYARLDSAPDPAQDAAVQALREAGHPVVTLPVADIYDLGQEFFLWEIATAVAGSLIGIDPFNQPDVESSKVETRRLTEECEKTGSLPSQKPALEEEGLQIFLDDRNRSEISRLAPSRSLAGHLAGHLKRLKPGDYFAILAYVEMTPAHERELNALRALLRDKLRVATCLGFGPRFLHSTGQAYKGGPNSGVFLQITAEPAAELPVPGRKYGFGLVELAQAQGDLSVLSKRERRVLRLHLTDAGQGLSSLSSAFRKALSTL